MKIIYTLDAKEQLKNIKAFIARDSNTRAIDYLKRLKEKIEILGKYPYLGKVNVTMDSIDIREFVVLGYKVIYKINENSITILVIYKYIDFNEEKFFNGDA